MSNYSRTYWEDSPNTEITAKALNNIEEGISTLDNNLANQNLFINGFFQIWSSGESVEVYGANNEEYYDLICDKWRAKHYDLVNLYTLSKTSDGMLFTSDSEESCCIYQQLDDDTFSSLVGKTVTQSWSWTDASGELQTSRQTITVGTELNVFTAETRMAFTDGCVLHWAKLEVGTMHTPCVPDSKDAIICKLEKRMVKTYSGENSIVGTGGWATFTVTFPEPFTEIPFVSVMQTSQASNENITLGEIDENGFTYEVYAPDTTFEYQSRWMAIGY